MTLSFKTKFDNGTETNFPDKILSGQKIHTIRKKGRWKAGIILHMATGVRSKNYDQFNLNYPNLKYCTGTQSISIVWATKVLPYVKIDGRLLEDGEIIVLAKNDGLTLSEFLEFFKKDNTELEIVHWTDFRYGR